MTTDFLIGLAKAVAYLPGVFAATFLIWDRYVKHRPMAIIVARPLMDGSVQIVPFLFFKNASDRPILVSWDNDRTKLRVGKDQSAHAILRSLGDEQTVVSLGPEAEAYLPVFKPNTYDLIDPHNRMELELKWRFAQPRFWIAERRLRISLRKRDLEEMIDGFMDGSQR
ncbi:hypothetical protein [Bradyrhizobium sp. S69]|uniref:hypothetical protein n=1 Tax=Bradyrhizobium sp. S69 TaxID=1641856 RepID=UPI00131BD224|nr:hypothetical protein [Bradyrhizobium sp. S69]